MGAIVNAVTDAANHLKFVGGNSRQSAICKTSGNINVLQKKLPSNMDICSKWRPILNESRSFGREIASGDFFGSALNGGLLALYVLLAGGITSNAKIGFGMKWGDLGLIVA